MGWQPKLENKVLKFTLFLVILGACWYFGRIFKVDVPYYQKLLSSYPVALSGLIFVLLYVGTTTFIWFGPKDVLRIASALLFGALVSTVFVWAAEMFNAAIMFHLSRVLGRDYVRQKLKVGPRKLDQMKDDTSLLGVIAWRINPLIPFRLMDLGFGLTKIPFRKYCVAVIGVTFIRIYWLQFILAGIGEALLDDFSSMINYLQDSPDAIQLSAYYFLAVAGITLTAIIVRIVKKRRKRSHGSTER